MTTISTEYQHPKIDNRIRNDLWISNLISQTIKIDKKFTIMKRNFIQT